MFVSKNQIPMKTHIPFWAIIIQLVLLCYSSSCDRDAVGYLVGSYDNAPWRIHTKSGNLEMGEEFSSYNVFSQMMSGFEDIDQFIVLRTERPGGLVEPDDPIFCTEAQYEALCKKHNDCLNPPVCRDAFYNFPQLIRPGSFSSTDFVKLEVISLEDFDETHPAGTSLLDLLYYATTTPNRVLRSGQLKFDSDVLVDDKGTQLFNTFKKGTDVRGEDMTIINFFYLSFDKLPEPAGPRNITVRLTADDGEVYEFETLLTFDKVG